MSTTTLEDITRLGIPSALDELLNDKGDDFQRAILVNAKTIYNEKIESQLVGKGIISPETTSNKELTVLCTNLNSTSPDRILFIKSTPYSFNFTLFDDATLTLTQRNKHGTLKDHDTGKKYNLPAYRKQGYEQKIITKNTLDKFILTEIDILQENIIKSSYFGMEETPISESRGYLQEKVDNAYQAHETIFSLFPNTYGYQKKWGISKTTNSLGKEKSRLDSLISFNLSLQHALNYVEGTYNELADNPTRHKQFLREAGLFGLTAAVTNFASPDIASYTFPLALMTGADLGVRIINQFTTGYSVGIIGMCKLLKEHIENTDSI